MKISCTNVVRLGRFGWMAEALCFSKCTMGIYTVKEIACGANTSTLQHIKVTISTTQMIVDNVLKKYIINHFYFIFHFNVRFSCFVYMPTKCG